MVCCPVRDVDKSQRYLDFAKDRSELSLLRSASSDTAKTVRNMRGQSDQHTGPLSYTEVCGFVSRHSDRYTPWISRECNLRSKIR